jgi:hypothetical protein
VPNLNRRSAATLVGVLLLAFAGGVDAANKKSKPGPPPKPIPTDRELGFYGNTRDEMRSSCRTRSSSSSRPRASK